MEDRSLKDLLKGSEPTKFEKEKVVDVVIKEIQDQLHQDESFTNMLKRMFNHNEEGRTSLVLRDFLSYVPIYYMKWVNAINNYRFSKGSYDQTIKFLEVDIVKLLTNTSDDTKIVLDDNNNLRPTHFDITLRVNYLINHKSKTIEIPFITTVRISMVYAKNVKDNYKKLTDLLRPLVTNIKDKLLDYDIKEYRYNVDTGFVDLLGKFSIGTSLRNYSSFLEVGYML